METANEPLDKERSVIFVVSFLVFMFIIAAMSVGVMANWLANFLVSEFFPSLAGVSLGLAYGIFTTFALVSFFYVLKYVKETKGVRLEDMEELEKAEM